MGGRVPMTPERGHGGCCRVQPPHPRGQEEPSPCCDQSVPPVFSTKFRRKILGVPKRRELCAKQEMFGHVPRSEAALSWPGCQDVALTRGCASPCLCHAVEGTAVPRGFHLPLVIPVIVTAPEGHWPHVLAWVCPRQLREGAEVRHREGLAGVQGGLAEHPQEHSWDRAVTHGPSAPLASSRATHVIVSGRTLCGYFWN